ncbi:unnamed protein product [Owenia fusiformis]|uniref:Uncharacterized protein n=1 Tax=Owenia fusiformis TaxID=6347 RepID=A0A8J1XZM5_OWEFU|nr:unnamed protein product [Owenia fusiformis]
MYDGIFVVNGLTCYDCTDALGLVSTCGSNFIGNDINEVNCSTSCYNTKTEVQVLGASTIVYTRGCDSTTHNMVCEETGGFVFGTGSVINTCHCSTDLCNNALFNTGSVLITICAFIMTKL